MDRADPATSIYQRNLRGAASHPLFDGVLRVTGDRLTQELTLEIFGGPSAATVDLFIGSQLIGSGRLDQLGGGRILATSWQEQLVGDIQLRWANQIVAASGPLSRVKRARNGDRRPEDTP